MPAKRRENNTGSISERRDNNGKVSKYEVRTPPDRDGKRLRRFAKTKAEAKKLLAALMEEREKKLKPRVDRRQTISTVYAAWIADHVVPNRRPKTIYSYQEIYRLYIEPQLGKIRLDELDEDTVKDWLKKLGERLSESTVQNAYQRLLNALDYAVEQKLVAQNIVRDMPKPRVSGEPRATALDPDQARRLLMAVKGHRLEPLYHLAIRLGLRIGELCGLLWSDINFAEKQLRITGQLQRIGNEFQRVQPKTRHSRRALPLSPSLVALLMDHQHRWEKEISILQVDSDYVFLNENGKHLDPDNLRRHYRGLLKKADLPPIRFHDLRHTAGSLMLANGGYLTDVAAVLGHSTSATTARIYAHSYEEGQRRALMSAEELLRDDK